MRPRCQPAERSSLGKSPPGDGRSALLLPGFLAGDYTLATLAIWLRGIGYRPRRVGFLANVDCSDRALRAVETRAEDIVEEEALVRTWHRHTTDRRERGGCPTEDCRCSFTRDYSATFPESVRLTSVYSKRDGVVRWQSCVVP